MGSYEKVRVNGEEMQEVDKFNYLGVMIRYGWFYGGGSGSQGT